MNFINIAALYIFQFPRVSIETRVQTQESPRGRRAEHCRPRHRPWYRSAATWTAPGARCSATFTSDEELANGTCPRASGATDSRSRSMDGASISKSTPRLLWPTVVCIRAHGLIGMSPRLSLHTKSGLPCRFPDETLSCHVSFRFRSGQSRHRTTIIRRLALPCQAQGRTSGGQGLLGERGSSSQRIRLERAWTADARRHRLFPPANSATVSRLLHQAVGPSRLGGIHRARLGYVSLNGSWALESLTARLGCSWTWRWARSPCRPSMQTA